MKNCITILPKRWRIFLYQRKWATCPGLLSPMAISACPATKGATRSAIYEPGYWLSASVFTKISAHCWSANTIPARKASQRPLLAAKLSTCVTHKFLATCTVASVLPSSITSVSMWVMPGRDLGSSAKTLGKVPSSFLQGIWISNFMWQTNKKLEMMRVMQRATS